MSTLNRAAIYVRISNDPTGQEAGVTRQREDCTALAERLGVTVIREPYEDNDISAYNGRRRPAYEELLAAMERNEFDTLICWHTDRLYRSLKDLEWLIDIAESRAVVIRTVNGGDLDLSTATGKMLARILGSVARAESEHKAERQRRANAQRAGEGKWWSSNRCFGYTQDGQVEVAEAAMIREAAADVLSGASVRSIARRWNAEGVTSTRGAEWNTARVKRMLVNPRYAAIRTYNGKEAAPGKWPAIIDTETHQGLVAILRDPARGKAVSYERKYIGSYRDVCGRCGSKMHHTVSTHAGGKSYSNYRCTAETHLSRSQPELDQYVEKVALEYLGRSDLLAARLADDGNGIDVNEAQTRRIALQARTDDLAAMFAAGDITAAQLKRATADLRGKIGVIDAQLAEAARRSPLVALLTDGPAEEVAQRWQEATPDIRGKVLDELFEPPRVSCTPSFEGRLLPSWRRDTTWSSRPGRCGW